MTTLHAPACATHRSARMRRFRAVPAPALTVRTQTHHSAQHGSAVPAQHELYAEVCDQLERIGQVVVAGSPVALADFRDYVDRHRPQVASHIVAYDGVDHPSEAQLAALARKHFDAKDPRNRDADAALAAPALEEA